MSIEQQMQFCNKPLFFNSFFRCVKNSASAALVGILILAVASTSTAIASFAESPQAVKKGNSNDLLPIHPEDARRAAFALARHAIEIEDAAILVSALSVMLQTGATLSDEDPWLTSELLDTAEAFAEDSPELVAALNRMRGSSKGACHGMWDGAIDVPSRGSISKSYRLEANNATDFEVVVRGDTIGVDIDLWLKNDDGTILKSMTGPDKGVVGRSAHLQYTPEAQTDVSLEIKNMSSVGASVHVRVTKVQDNRC